MNKVEEIEQNLFKIKALIDKEEQVYGSSEIFHGAMGARMGFRQKIALFRDNFNIFCLLKNFFSSNTLDNLEERLRPLLKLYEDFSSSDQNITDKQSTLDEFYKAIDSLPNLREVSIEFPENINKDDFENLLNLLRNQYGIFLDDENEDFFNKTSLLNFREHQKKLIELYNIVISKDERRVSEIIYYNDYFNILLQRSAIKAVEIEIDELDKKRKRYIEEIAELNQRAENLVQKSSQVSKEITSQSNEKLQQAFDDKAKDLKPEIEGLHKNIMRLFSLIVFLIFSMFLYIALNHDFKIERFYILYLSIFLTLSAVLTYLIRERIRLVKYQHYCNISFLEIDALSTYTAQLNDPDKIEELKIQLAYRYFQGPNGYSNQTADEKELSYFSSKINELTNMVKDIKSLVDK